MQSSVSREISQRNGGGCGGGSREGGRELLSDLLPSSEPSVWCWPSILRHLAPALTNIYISHIQLCIEVALLAELRPPGKQIEAGQNCGSDARRGFFDGRGRVGGAQAAHNLMDYGMSAVDWLCDQGL